MSYEAVSAFARSRIEHIKISPIAVNDLGEPTKLGKLADAATINELEGIVRFCEAMDAQEKLIRESIFGKTKEALIHGPS
jgi:hypothetical protein